MSESSRSLCMQRPLYGGEVLAEDGRTRLPFVLPGEVIQVEGGEFRVTQVSPQRVDPRCPHFGACGGCQYQMIAPAEQLNFKRRILRDLLLEAGCSAPDDIAAHAGEPYGYRNRIRLRVQRAGAEWLFGYNVRATTQFLPITTCPIAAPVLWQTAEAILESARANGREFGWLEAASELELFTNDTLDKLQLTFFCPPRTRLPQGSFARMMRSLSEAAPVIAGASAVALDPRTGPTGRVFETWGADGLSYRVRNESYWISRGGFFQVNRFLLPKLVELVCDGRSGDVAWDLFAGVGLFSRVLAKSFARVTDVEANGTAANDLAKALRKLGSGHEGREQTTLDFLRRAVLERDRPGLIVLDPPRAGAGEETCELIARLAPREIVYVSCDPTTLARDWRVLEARGYRATSTDVVDLFPQTFHLETVVAFGHRS